MWIRIDGKEHNIKLTKEGIEVGIIVRGLQDIEVSGASHWDWC